MSYILVGSLYFMKLYNATTEFVTWRKRQNFSSPTTIQNESNLRQFAIFMRNCELEAVQEKDVLDYLGMLEEEFKVQNNSMIPKVNAIRQFLKYWNKRKEGVLHYEMVPLKNKEFTQPEVCNQEDYDKFWSVISAPSNNHQRIRNAAMVAIMAATGIRNGEACSIEINNVDAYNPMVIPIQDGGLAGFDSMGRPIQSTRMVNMYRGIIKTEKSRGMKPFREIFWSEDVNKHVHKWAERRQELHEKHSFANPDLLFVGLNSRHADNGGWGRRLTPNAVDEIFRRYSREAKVKVRPHMLRHMLGIDMAQQDASEHIISEVLGHSRLDSSRMYTKLHGRAIGRQFWRFRGNTIPAAEPAVQAEKVAV